MEVIPAARKSQENSAGGPELNGTGVMVLLWPVCGSFSTDIQDTWGFVVVF